SPQLPSYGCRRCLIAAVLAGLFAFPLAAQEGKGSGSLIRSAKSGPWSSPATWEGSKVPGPAAKVQIRAGHSILYDVAQGPAIRMIHVAGTLTFARDRDTQLDVGLIKIQPGDDASEEGFECDAHLPPEPPSLTGKGATGLGPALE